MKTKVIFKKCSNGQIVAAFPQIPWDNSPFHLQCYEHVGQHGNGAESYLILLTPAKPVEYSELLKELKAIGYDVKIAHRFTWHDFNIRKAQLRGTS